MIGLAGAAGNQADRLVGQRLRAVTLHYSGDQHGARQALDAMLRDYPAEYGGQHRIRMQFDQSVLGRAVLSRVLWLQGFADQALRLTHDNIESALAGGHVLSLCYALTEGACPVALMARDLDAAERYVRLVLEIAAQNELSFWGSWGRCLEGELLSLRGDTPSAAHTLMMAIEAFRAGGWATRLPDFLGACGRALGIEGRVPEGLAMINGALALAAKEGERWSTPELLRNKGELVLKRQPRRGRQQAEALFVESLEMAQRHGALALELRAATSLARLRRGRGDADALAPLARAYARFTEGFETADLLAAREELEDRPIR